MDIYGNKLVNTIETKPLCASSSDLSNQFLCRLRSIAAHRDHFVRRLSVYACVCLSDSHTFLIVTHSYVSQATHAFLGMLPLCLHLQIAWINQVVVFTSGDGHIMTPKYTQYQKGVRPVASNLLWARSTSVTDVITKNISFVLCNPTIVEIYKTTLSFLLYVFL